jgi:7,8-dihydro-6-hydroxymethylpterin-pyrophosphokinase
VLDIDILFFGRQVIADAQLEIPHPRLHERAFVLRPLMEIAADFCHPENGLAIDTLYQDFLASPEGTQECLPL